MAEPKIGIVGIPGKWSTEALADAVEARTGFRLVIDMADVVLDLHERRLMHGDVDLCALDGLVIKKISESYSPHALDRLEMLRLPEAAGVRVFSPPNAILRTIDRLACTVTLCNGGIPMPETLVTESVDQAVEAVGRLGTAVFKPLYSTKARGMAVINGSTPDREIRAAVEAFHADNPVMYLQRKLDLPGRDLGLVFLKGNYLGAYARVAGGEAWNTTIHSGGRYASFEPPGEWIDLAKRAVDLFGLDFTTVDLAETADGPVIFEVSAFGGFRGAKEGAAIDAAALYVDHVLERVRP
ncbi:GAK system ATP-grasp enzyme [Magnetospira sp. QH-2]|uniref:GAK system ATP-grasp enzyme n=1 Tax=Magnetospira sp. (strain QH-2) TaxID=1288970 RepID=UPI0003E811B3|nr:GAK system ATP-grasp enzyme [Magnetospira sp. QH-2]CCQ72148.1 putative ribosomal protein S6 [Magnetospira sp. QH-2]